jgi:hypothetical protein
MITQNILDIPKYREPSLATGEQRRWLLAEQKGPDRERRAAAWYVLHEQKTSIAQHYKIMFFVKSFARELASITRKAFGI